tara:strand:- start:2445 stop:3188 length:744 start_codon:yes stop_codon:yes gene_type:complete
MDLVSIVIPYYKKKEYIKQSINSVLSQTYKNFEIIIIYDDEELTDFNYLKNIVKLDKRINLIRNKKKLGAGLSRNKGVKLSKGKYVAFLDSDDYWNKNKLKAQIAFMNLNKCSISHTTYQIVNKNDKKISVRRAKSFFKIQDLLYSCDIGLSTVILKKNLFSNDIKFPNIKTKEDFILWLKILKKKIPIVALDKNLSCWRKLNNSLSSSTIQKIFDGFKVYYIYMNYGIFRSILNLIFLSVNFLKKR